METNVIQLLLTALNLVCAAWMYREKNYKTAMLNTFVAGFCFCMFLKPLIDFLWNTVNMKILFW